MCHSIEEEEISWFISFFHTGMEEVGTHLGVRERGRKEGGKSKGIRDLGGWRELGKD